MLPSIAAYVRAAHWAEGEFPPGLGSTIAIVGLLYKFGVEHPWRERAAGYCFAGVEGEPPKDAHAIRDALHFLEHVPERDRAEALVVRLADMLRGADYFLADADDERYGLRPLAFAPAPDSRWRALFSDDEIDAHLTALAREQDEDGGWPLRWQPPSDAARCEWRGFATLQALRVLVAYRRASPWPGRSAHTQNSRRANDPLAATALLPTRPTIARGRERRRGMTVLIAGENSGLNIRAAHALAEPAGALHVGRRDAIRRGARGRCRGAPAKAVRSRRPAVDCAPAQLAARDPGPLSPRQPLSRTHSRGRRLASREERPRLAWSP